MLIFVIATRYKVPARTQLSVSYVPAAPVKDVSKIDISQIYRNDLFNTYKETPAQTAPQEEKKLQLPPPPSPRAAATVERRPVQFLEPLAVTLKGIMYSTQEQHNRVVIEDKKSGKEKLYKVGDALEDAEIVRIYYNKVMLIRSNGQQETLFVSPQDAQKDPQYKHEIVWQNIIHQKAPTEFMIDKNHFVAAIKNLAEFIDMLDITTAFKKGKTIGCRIGALKPQTVGPALGLLPNDVILSVDDIPTITTNDRVEIFTRIKNMGEQETVSVKILRNGNEIVQHYSLTPESPVEPEPEQPQSALPAELQHMHDMSSKLVAESHTTKNPMVEQIHKQNLSAMTTATAPSSLLQQVPT
jgi:type II secretory pathway component PulC